MMSLNMKEKHRIEVIQSLMDGRLTMMQAQQVLGRSERQIWRILRRVRDEGLEGIIHKNKGRRSPRRIPSKIRRKIVSLAKGKLKDINDTHLQPPL